MYMPNPAGLPPVLLLLKSQLSNLEIHLLAISQKVERMNQNGAQFAIHCFNTVCKK